MSSNNEDRFEEAFDLVKHVFKIDILYDDQIKLIKALVMESPLYFNHCLGFMILSTNKQLEWQL